MYYNFQTKRLERIVYNLLNGIPLSLEEKNICNKLKNKFNEKNNKDISG